MVRGILKKLNRFNRGPKSLKKKLEKENPPKGKCSLTKPIIDGHGEIQGFHCECFDNPNLGHPIHKKQFGRQIIHKINYADIVRTK